MLPTSSWYLIPTLLELPHGCNITLQSWNQILCSQKMSHQKPKLSKHPGNHKGISVLKENVPPSRWLWGLSWIFPQFQVFTPGCWRAPHSVFLTSEPMFSTLSPTSLGYFPRLPLLPPPPHASSSSPSSSSSSFYIFFLSKTYCMNDKCSNFILNKCFASNPNIFYWPCYPSPTN